MDDKTGRDRLARGIAVLDARRPAHQRREDYYRGRQDLPFAPDGVNAEYMALREMAVANWLGLAMDTPAQRLRVDGFRTGRDADADLTAWHDVWQANRLDARQRIVYQQMLVHGRGLCSVWPNARDRARPLVRPEDGLNVHVEMLPDDPFTPDFAVKRYVRVDERLWIAKPLHRDIAVVYDDNSWMRFERGGNLFGAEWIVTDSGSHPMRGVPFVNFDIGVGADGVPTPGIEPLMPAQDAINTIRFNTLLAMQFSAFRQRVFVGFDPVVRDERGMPVPKRDAEGNPVLDGNGNPVPQLSSPGRVGVDRALVFPGENTKVFDLPESNLDHYISVLGEFMTDLFAVGQIPPQYLLTRMANLSGDALAGAESTLASLVSDLQESAADPWEQVMRFANRARGGDEDDLASEVIWGDGEARSFAQIADAITKLVSVKFPRQAAFELLPGATPQKVQRWMQLSEAEQATALDSVLADAFRTEPQQPDVTTS